MAIFASLASPIPVGGLTTDFDASRRRRVHLIGAAGSGMRALAEVFIRRGWRTSGSDLQLDGAAVLGQLGVRLFHGHSADHVSHETELVVYSDAVPPDNPERRRAVELGIPAISYFEMLGRLSADQHTVAVAGTHGKSTTTAMTAHLLVDAGLDPTVFCGATPLGKTTGGRAGCCSSLSLGEGQGVRAIQGRKAEGGRWKTINGAPPERGRHPPSPLRSLTPALTLTLSQRERGLPIVLVEACEYRANFLHLRPRHAVILGIEPDHFDCYDSLEQIERAFRRFADSIPSDGFLLVRHDCDSTRRATEGLACRIETFGLAPEADWSAQGLEEHQGRYQFEIWRGRREFCGARLQVPGLHNVLNALAAAALAHANGAAADRIAAGLAGFAGLHRRLEVLCETEQGIAVVDDYAHHPTEIAVSLAAVRRMFPRRRVWCVFQPHQALRTARLMDPLAESLQNADRVQVAEIFRAREGPPQPGEVTADDLARQVAQRGVAVMPGRSDEEIRKVLETHLAPGDVLVTLGASDMRRFRPLPKDSP